MYEQYIFELVKIFIVNHYHLSLLRLRFEPRILRVQGKCIATTSSCTLVPDKVIWLIKGKAIS